MRRLLAMGALGAVLAAGPALGHPGHGPTEVRVGDDFFLPAEPRVATGDTVVWKWIGPGENHSVTADPGQEDSFDSDPGKPASAIAHPPGSTFTHRFTHTGRFTYGCRVHPAMRGEITVITLPPRDLTRPVISKVSVRPNRVCERSAPGCRAARAFIRLTMSERATVVGRVDQRVGKRWKLIRTFDFDALKGRTRKRLHVRGFEPGPYRLRLVAYDSVGNRSRSTKLRFGVRGKA